MLVQDEKLEKVKNEKAECMIRINREYLIEKRTVKGNAGKS